MKIKKDSEEAIIAKFKLDAEQAKATLKKHKDAAKKLPELANYQVKQLETEPWNILRWVR